jgi:hypothetical protein
LSEHATAHRDFSRSHVALGSYPPVRAETGYQGLGLIAHWEDHFRCKQEPAHPWTFTDVVDGNLSAPASLLLDVGGWDEDFPGGRRQDWELGVRLLERGIPLGYYPQARAWHHFDPRLTSALWNRRQEGANDVLLATKHPQVVRQLPLGHYATNILARRYSAAGLSLASGRAGDAALASAIPLVELLERFKLARAWAHLFSRMLAHAYVSGVADACGSVPGLAELVRPMARREAVQTVDVRLDRSGNLDLHSPGWTELALRCGDHELARVAPIGPEGQWDWRAVTEKVGAAAIDWHDGALLECQDALPELPPFSQTEPG